MVDIHITTWQGALRTNNFKAIQERVKGKLICMGGIDSIVDHKGWTEEEVRAEVRRAIAEYAPYGAYIPCITYGLPESIFPGVLECIMDEVNKYNEEHMAK